MLNKKLFMRLSKFVIVAIIASSVNGVVYAKDSDIYNASNEKIGRIILANKSALVDMITNIKTYNYELSCGIYNLNEVNNLLLPYSNETVEEILANGIVCIKSKDDVPITTSLAIAVQSASVSTATTADKSTLNAEITAANTLVQTNYTNTSWTNMQAALTNAKVDVVNATSTQTDVKADITSLTNAINLLVAPTAQKIAKIEIISTIVGVSSPTTSGGVTVGGKGYATYKVLDQYGDDITTSALDQDITWICGVGTVTSDKGLLTITPFNGTFLTQYTTITINGFYETTGVTTSADLTTP